MTVFIFIRQKEQKEIVQYQVGSVDVTLFLKSYI